MHANPLIPGVNADPSALLLNNRTYVSVTGSDTNGAAPTYSSADGVEWNYE